MTRIFPAWWQGRFWVTRSTPKPWRDRRDPELTELEEHIEGRDGSRAREETTERTAAGVPPNWGSAGSSTRFSRFKPGIHTQTTVRAYDLLIDFGTLENLNVLARCPLGTARPQPDPALAP